jgi:hypothetical protein
MAAEKMAVLESKIEELTKQNRELANELTQTELNL